MGTLAQLLDKPANPLTYVMMPSSSSGSSDSSSLSRCSKMNLNTSMEIEDEMEIIYKRPVRVLKNGTNRRRKREVGTTANADFEDHHHQSDYACQSVLKSKLNLLKKSASSSPLPGSRLSLIATSLPCPNNNIFNNYGKKKKPMPALSPIVSTSLSANFNNNNSSNINNDTNRAKTPPLPVIVNVTSLYPPNQQSEKMNLTLISTSDNEESITTGSKNFKLKKSETLVEGMLKPGKKNRNQIKRPLNAFMVWSKLQRRRIMDNDPTMHHSLISKQLGQGWKQLSAAEREPYYEEAKRLGELHTKIYPDYKYQPRKRSKASVPFSTHQPGPENSHSMVQNYNSSSDLSSYPNFNEKSLLNLKVGQNGGFIRKTLDGSLDLSVKRLHPIAKDALSFRIVNNAVVKGSLSNVIPNNTAFSESDSTDDSSFDTSQPLNMSLKSDRPSSRGLQSWSQVFEDDSDKEEMGSCEGEDIDKPSWSPHDGDFDDSESEDDRLVIDE